MKSQVPVLFDEWLTLMERAFEILNLDEFEQLEHKIEDEITRRRRSAKRPK